MTAYQYEDRLPRQRREPPRYVVRQDPGNLLALRAIAYVCTSVASILFVVLAIYGYVKVQQLGAALSQLGGGLPSVSAPSFTPPAPLPLPLPPR